MSIHILLVADSPEVIDQLQSLLEQAGHTVTVGDNFTAPPPVDLVLVDVTSVRFSPFAGLQAQRRMGSTAPVLLLSGRLTDQMATEMFSLGVRDFVLKPIDDDALLDRLEEFTARMQEEQGYIELSQRLERSEATLARRLEEMNTLSRIGRSIAALSDIGVMMSHIVDAAVFLTHAEEGAIFLVNERGDLHLRAQKGLGAKQSEIIDQPARDSDAVEALRTGQPIQRSADTEHKVKTGFFVRAQINVPIVIGRQIGGVLGVYNHSASFSPNDQTVLTHLADFAAIALDKVRSIQAVEARRGGNEGLTRSNPTRRTLSAPIEGIESLVETLLRSGFGPLTEEQRTAISRIKQATVRLNEITDYIDQAISKLSNGETAG
jgi:two-component system NtrC family sensor kinase